MKGALIDKNYPQGYILDNINWTGGVHIIYIIWTGGYQSEGVGLYGAQSCLRSY